MHPASSAQTVGQASPIATRSLFSRGALAAGRAARARVAPREAFGRFFGKKSAEDAVSAVDGAGPSSAAAAAMDPADGRACCPWRTARTTPGPGTSFPTRKTERRAPNRSSREVKSGRPFVRVRPTPLRNPRVALYSKAMAANVGIEESEVTGSSRFARFFSGDADAVPGMDTWATPYALSIMGKRQFQNCPFATRSGYGDGRR